MNILSLASRNVRRNPRRSLATISAIVVGAVSILLFGGFASEINYGLKVETIRASGHLQIQQKYYYLFGSADPTAYSIADYQQIIDAVKEDPILKQTVRVITPVLQLGGIAGNFEAGRSRTAWASAAIPEEVDQLQEWDERGTSKPGPKLALTGTAEDVALIGTGMARALHICEPFKVDQCDDSDASNSPKAAAQLAADVRDLSQSEQQANDHNRRNDLQPTMDFLTATAQGAPSVAQLKVGAVLSNNVKQIDDLLVVMHLSQAQQLVYGRETPQVTSLIVQLQRTDQIAATQARLVELLKEKFPKQSLAIYDYEKLNPFYGQATGFLNTIFAFIAVLMAVIVAFSVSNTMGMIVAERTTEIGTIRALGLRQSGVRRIFIAEGFVFGLIGAVVGALVALAIALGINRSGLKWTPPGRTESTQLLVGLLGDYRLIVWTVVVLIVLSILSSWFPSRRAAKLVIVEALRHV